MCFSNKKIVAGAFVMTIALALQSTIVKADTKEEIAKAVHEITTAKLASTVASSMASFAGGVVADKAFKAVFGDDTLTPAKLAEALDAKFSQFEATLADKDITIAFKGVAQFNPKAGRDDRHTLALAALDDIKHATSAIDVFLKHPNPGPEAFDRYFPTLVDLHVTNLAFWTHFFTSSKTKYGPKKLDGLLAPLAYESLRELLSIAEKFEERRVTWADVHQALMQNSDYCGRYNYREVIRNSLPPVYVSTYTSDSVPVTTNDKGKPRVTAVTAGPYKGSKSPEQLKEFNSKHSVRYVDAYFGPVPKKTRCNTYNYALKLPNKFVDGRPVYLIGAGSGSPDISAHRRLNMFIKRDRFPGPKGKDGIKAVVYSLGQLMGGKKRNEIHREYRVAYNQLGG